MDKIAAGEEIVILSRNIIGQRIIVDGGKETVCRVTAVFVETERLQFRFSWWNNGSLQEGYADSWRCTFPDL